MDALQALEVVIRELEELVSRVNKAHQEGLVRDEVYRAIARGHEVVTATREELGQWQHHRTRM